jgi:hypothetical protein
MKGVFSLSSLFLNIFFDKGLISSVMPWCMVDKVMQHVVPRSK